jgi:hypothetical protein
MRIAPLLMWSECSGLHGAAALSTQFRREQMLHDRYVVEAECARTQLWLEVDEDTLADPCQIP